MDHATFLRAICAAPADDGPRLVYADWLEDEGQGDRAEFIRVQCELAKPSDCKTCGGKRWYEIDEWNSADCIYCAESLRRRERELLERHAIKMGGGWVGEVGQLIPRWQLGRDIIFRRGFIDSVTLSWPDWLAHAAAIREAQPVTRVRLTTWPVLDVLTTARYYIDFNFRGRPVRRLERPGGVNLSEDGWKEILAAEWPGIAFELPSARTEEVFRREVRTAYATASGRAGDIIRREDGSPVGILLTDVPANIYSDPV